MISKRDINRDIFEEINLLMIHNQKLQNEINELRRELNNLSDQTQVARTLQTNIDQKQKIAGRTDINGSGVEITILKKIDDVWYIDLINELFTAGAEAVSINNIRLVDSNAGILFSGGQIIINGTAITDPYSIKAIGNPLSLYQALNQSGGILKRLNIYYPELNINIQKSELIEMRQII
jgi:uncharacterized protein YlxW (UPF0749 family)